jgi:ELWxxDGT repeat protein
LADAFLFAAIRDPYGRELWRSDGTAEGTYLVKDINASGSAFKSPMFRMSSADQSDLLFFPADDGIHGEELWMTDGTEDGTVLVDDIRPGFVDSSVQYLTSSGDLVYFRADDGVGGPELWRSDGTEAGTALVKDIREGFNNVQQLTDVAGKLYFTAIDPQLGAELWVSDGTEAGTVLVRDIKPTSPPRVRPS